MPTATSTTYAASSTGYSSVSSYDTGSSTTAYGAPISSIGSPATSATYGGANTAAPPTYGSSTPYGASPCASSTAAQPTPLPSPTAAVPGTIVGNPYAPACGSTNPVVPTNAATASPAGFSATLTSTQTTGLFTKTVTGVTVLVTNNDPQEESHFVIVSFTLNNNEVAVAYHRVDLTPGAQQTLTFPVPDDSTGNAITADDAHVEVKDSLL